MVSEQTARGGMRYGVGRRVGKNWCVAKTRLTRSLELITAYYRLFSALDFSCTHDATLDASFSLFLSHHQVFHALATIQALCILDMLLETLMQPLPSSRLNHLYPRTKYSI